MRKLLLLATATLLLASCSKESVQYDYARGYLTNLASAQEGIIGSWTPVEAGDWWVFDRDGYLSYRSAEGSVNAKVAYEVLKSGKSYLLRRYTATDRDGDCVENQLYVLSKTGLVIIEGSTEIKYKRAI